MKFDKKFVVELTGIVAVVGSLLLVASELRLSNSIATRESREAIVTLFYEMNMSQYENPQNAELMTKLSEASPKLTDEETFRAKSFVRAYVALAGLINSSYDSGMLPDTILEGHMGPFRSVFRESPGLNPFFEQSLAGYAGRGYAFDRIIQVFQESR